jgi:hypothetical protein
MNTVCLKILSVSIVLTVCCIDPNVAYVDMSNAMKAIALMSENEIVNVETGNKSSECTYVIDLTQESAEEIAQIITLADRINKQIKTNSKKVRADYKTDVAESTHSPKYVLSSKSIRHTYINTPKPSRWFTLACCTRAGPCTI